ncbi:MAG: T9SS type A sorting domain-containing protein [Ignavibacteria bacterium]|nr:T9SS type A sorting domain-containing protein [Ignavibacteria bacterium]
MEKLNKLFWLCLFISSSYLYSSPLADSSYFPMSIGNEWGYYSNYDPHSEIIVDTLRKNGVLYYGFTRSVTEPEYWLREYGNRVYYLNLTDSTEFILFDFTINIGDSIELPSGYECSFGRKIFLVSKSDTIITPAGTFYNCYHFDHGIYCMDAGIHDTWFAKGIGKVKYVAEYIVGINNFLLNTYSILTSIDENYDNKINTSYKLFQNYPNPFNPTTTIEYIIAKSDNVRIVLYDVLGREVKSILNEYKNAGSYKVLFNADYLSSGIYYYQLINRSYTQTKSMILLK